jgi:hypothetical protein
MLLRRISGPSSLLLVTWVYQVSPQHMPACGLSLHRSPLTLWISLSLCLPSTRPLHRHSLCQASAAMGTMTSPTVLLTTRTSTAPCFGPSSGEVKAEEPVEGESPRVRRCGGAHAAHTVCHLTPSPRAHALRRRPQDFDHSNEIQHCPGCCCQPTPGHPILPRVPGPDYEDHWLLWARHKAKEPGK